MVIFVGCEQHAPTLEDKETIIDDDSVNKGKNNISDSNVILGETITIDSSNDMQNDTNNEEETTIDSSLKKKHKNKGIKYYNSSLDGFKSIYFDVGKNTISSIMQENMFHNTEVVGQTRGMIQIEGNCDEFGTDGYNYALGLERANNVRKALVAQGIKVDKMLIKSFGEGKPVCSNFYDDCYVKNRRVDFRIIPVGE